MSRLKQPKIKPTDEEILATKKPFSQILKNYNMISKFKGKLWWGAGFGLMFIVLIVFFSVKNFTNEAIEKQITNDSLGNFINQPLKSIGVDYKSVICDCNQPFIIETENGTKIYIPEHAFVDDRKTPISDSVLIVYREFLNPTDIFLSGIPMRYDSLKEKYIFESAGMIELKAFNNDIPVNLAQGKKIKIEFIDDNDNTDFNVYYLDTAIENWVYKGKDAISKMDNVDEDVNETKMSNQKKTENIVEKTNPFVKPRLAAKNKNIFRVKYDETAFPEFKIYKKVLFEVDESVNKFNKEWYKINWDLISLKRISKENNTYEVKLQKRDSIVNLLSHAVIDEKEYENAVIAFNEQNVSTNYKPETQVVLSEKSQKLVTNLKETVVNRTTRSFDINALGVWNIDKPYPVPSFSSFPNQIAIVDQKTGEKLNCQSVFVIPLKYNMLIENNCDKLLFLSESENICFALIDEEKIVIVDPYDFKNAFISRKTIIKGNVYQSIEGLAIIKTLVGC